MAEDWVNYTKMKRLNLICFCLFILGQISLFAEIVWTGANGADIFDEDNWDLSNSLVEVIDPNFSIDDDVIIKDALSLIHISEPTRPY